MARSITSLTSGAHPHVSADHVLDLLVDMVADRVVARLGTTPANDYYDQHASPVGKRRVLEAARRGAFASMKRGKLVLARRVDVDAWIRAGHRTPRSVSPMSETDSDEALLHANGIVLAPVPRRTKG